MLQCPSTLLMGFPGGSVVKNSPAMQETPIQFLGWEVPWRSDRLPTPVFLGFPRGSAGKESTCNAGDPFHFLCQKIPWRRDSLPTPVFMGFPGGSDGKESACNVGDLGSVTGLGRSLDGGHGNPLQYSCPENPYRQRRLEGCLQTIGSQRVGHT